MALGPRLELRQGQGLVITPQLQQAIKLLQLSSVELEAYVEAELERNPLLQRDERDESGEPPAVDAERAPEIAETSLDRISDAQAAAEIDAPPDDLYADASPGEALVDAPGQAARPIRPGARSTGRAPAAAAASTATTAGLRAACSAS